MALAPHPRDLPIRSRRILAKMQNQLDEFSSPTFVGITLTGLTASRLVSTDASKSMSSVADLTTWVGGTVNQVISTSDGDGTITLSTPQDIHVGASPTFVTVDLTGVTDNNIPYMGGSGFADSPFAMNGSDAWFSDWVYWDESKEQIRLGDNVDDDPLYSAVGEIQINREGSNPTIKVHAFSDSNGAYIWGTRTRGTMASPTAVQADDHLVGFGCSGYDGVSASRDHALELKCFASENWSATQKGSYVTVGTITTGDTAITTWMWWKDEMLGIGATPVDANLYIDDTSGNNTNQLTTVGYNSTAKGHLGNFQDTNWYSCNAKYRGSWGFDDNTKSAWQFQWGTAVDKFRLRRAPADGGGTVTWSSVFEADANKNFITGGLEAAATSATNSIAMQLGTAPSANITNGITFYVADFAAGNSCPYFRTENGTVIGLNQSLLTSDKVQFAGGIQTIYAEDDVSDPPRDSELDSVFGEPGTLGSGFVGILDDNSGNTNCYICWTNDSSWWYVKGTKATDLIVSYIMGEYWPMNYWPTDYWVLV